MIVQNNLMALNAQRQTAMNNMALKTSLMRLSSGYRINSAADDAAGLAISERMRAQQTALERAMMNAQDGVSMTQTAEGALGEVHSMLNRLSELATQASNGIYSDSQRPSINDEAQQLLKEIDRISQATNFNGIQLLDGSMQNGSNINTDNLRLTENAAVAGSATYQAMGDITGLTGGDTIDFTVNLSDGGSDVMRFTLSDDMSGLVAGDGTVYALDQAASGGQVTVSGEVLAGAVANQLQKGATGDSFTVNESGGAITLKNREAGVSATQINSFAYSVNGGGYNQMQETSRTSASDATTTVSKESLRVFNGRNEDAATFTVNGRSFILVDENSAAGTVDKLQNSDVNIIKVGTSNAANLSEAELRSVAANINFKAGTSFTADASGLVATAPSGGGRTLQVGDTGAAHNQVSVTVGNMSARGLGLSGLDLSSLSGAQSALSRIGTAIDKVSTARGGLGATQNRLQSTLNNLAVTNENITASESRVRDTDMAKTLMEFTKRNILSQASTSMLAQANLQSQQVLGLLR